MCRSISIIVAVFTYFYKNQTDTRNNQVLNDLKSSIELGTSKVKAMIIHKANESRYLDIFAASRVTKTIKLHMHYIT